MSGGKQHRESVPIILYSCQANVARRANYAWTKTTRLSMRLQQARRDLRQKTATLTNLLVLATILREGKKTNFSPSYLQLLLPSSSLRSLAPKMSSICYRFEFEPETSILIVGHMPRDDLWRTPEYGARRTNCEKSRDMAILVVVHASGHSRYSKVGKAFASDHKKNLLDCLHHGDVRS